MLVDTHDQVRVTRAAVSILKHRVNQLWDIITPLDAIVDKNDPELVLAELRKIGSIGCAAMKITEIWARLLVEMRAAGAPADEPIVEIPNPEQTLVIPPDPDECPPCTCAPESAIHADECPRGKWLFGAANPPAPAAAATIPEDDIPF